MRGPKTQLGEMQPWHSTVKKNTIVSRTDALDVGHGASLLQVRDRMWFPRNKAPDSVALWHK